MNSEVVCGGSAAGVFGANGFHDVLEPVAAVGFFGCAPKVILLLGTGFGAGLKTCFVFDHMLAGAEPILLNIEGSAGAADGGWIGLPLSCGTLDELEFGFFCWLGASFFAANGFRLLQDQPSARAVRTAASVTAKASTSEAAPFTARLLFRQSKADERVRM
jgi:hypothetical protein